MCLNHPELVHKHLYTLLLLVEKVRYSRTTPNSCNRTLHTLLSLVREGSRRFDVLELQSA